MTEVGRWPRRHARKTAVLLGVCTALATRAAADAAGREPAAATRAVWLDPTGDDNGPGSYVYPTRADAAGALDLLEVVAQWRPGGWLWTLTFRRPPQPKLQPLVHIYLDTDGIAGSGHTSPLPGLGKLQLPTNGAWDKALLVAPQPRQLVQALLRTQASAMQGAVILPATTRWRGRRLQVQLPADALGPPRASWRIGVAVVAASDNPPADSLLSMPVRTRATPEQLGGGTDAPCCSHVVDVLAGSGAGSKAEIAAQHQALGYACDGKVAVLPLPGWRRSSP